MRTQEMHLLADHKNRERTRYRCGLAPAASGQVAAAAPLPSGSPVPIKPRWNSQPMSPELRIRLSTSTPETERTSGFEVDFLVGGETAIEVKSSKRIGDSDLKGLRTLSEETKLRKRIVVSTELRERKTDDGIVVLPIQTFLKRLWEDDIVQP